MYVKYRHWKWGNDLPGPHLAHCNQLICFDSMSLVVGVFCCSFHSNFFKAFNYLRVLFQIIKER